MSRLHRGPCDRLRWMGLLLALLVLSAGVVEAEGVESGALLPERDIRQQTAELPPWKSQWDLARALVRDEDYPRAAETYETLLARNPRLLEARWELARLLLRLERADQALVHLELINETLPDHPPYIKALSTALLDTRHYSRAIELLKRLLSLTPDEPELSEQLARALLAAGDHEQALPLLEQLYIQDRKNNPLAWQLVELYFKLGAPDKARPLLGRLAQSSSWSEQQLELAAELHEALGQDEAAALYWRRLLALNGGHLRASQRYREFLLRKGRGREALAALKGALGREPENPGLLLRLATVSRGLNRLDEALGYLENYLILRPDERRGLQLALDLHNALGNRAEALLALERMLALDDKPDPEMLLQAALLYERRGEEDKALALYRRLAEIRPREARITAHRLSLLSRLGRGELIAGIIKQWEGWHPAELLLDLLEKWYELEPGNSEILIRRARVFLARNQMEEAEEVLLSLKDQAGESASDYFRLRAEVYLAGERPYAALFDFEQLLKLRPRDRESRLLALELSGRLGLGELVKRHGSTLTRSYPADPEVGLAVAAAHREALNPEAALAELARIEEGELAPHWRVALLRERARIMERAGLPHEAEGALRMALESVETGEEGDILAQLFDLALGQNDLDAAAIWLAALERGRHSGSSSAGSGTEAGCDTPAASLLAKRLRLWSASGDQREVVRSLRALLVEDYAECGGDFLLTAARTALAADAPWLARQWLDGADRFVGVDPPPSRTTFQPEFWLISVEINRALARDEESEALFEELRSLAARDPGRELRLAASLYEHRLYRLAAELAGEAFKAIPTSTPALLLQAQSLAELGEKERALELLARYASPGRGPYPLESRRVGWLFDLGRLEAVIDLAESQLAAHPWSEPVMGLAGVHALWLQRHRGEALKRLQQMRDPSFFADFSAAVRAEGLEPPPVATSSLWGRMIGAQSPLSELLDELMSPAKAAGLLSGDQKLKKLAAGWYARYRQQQRYTLEFEARRAVERGEFFAATRKIEKLHRLYPGEAPLLYDLAGLYSRQGSLEREAEIYRRLGELEVEYPGLNQARERNRLKRRSRTTAAYGRARSQGWDGYLEMDRQEVALSHWMAPRLGHELEIGGAKLRYNEPEGPRSLQARRLDLLYRREAFAQVDMLMGISAWLPADKDEGGRDLILGRGEVAGDLGDRFWGRLSFDRELVEDTVASVSRGITVDSLGAEASVDLLPRLEAGAGYRFHYFSDGNQSHDSDLHISYTVFTDPTLLSVGYRYAFRDTDHGPNPQGAALDDGFSGVDHPYWAPNTYWRKSLELVFRHQLSDDPFLRDAPRYYTLRYLSGIDSQGHPHQELGGSLFLELNDRLIVRAGFELTTADNHRHREFTSALTFRW